MRTPELPGALARRAIVRAAAAFAASTSFGPSAEALAPPQTNGDQIVLPLMCAGSAFCTEYYIDGRRFRAVVDTGSPFLLVDGSQSAGFERWGRFAEDDAPLSVSLGDYSEEGFGGQDVDVEWRRGSLRLAGYPSPHVTYSALPVRAHTLLPCCCLFSEPFCFPLLPPS